MAAPSREQPNPSLFSSFFKARQDCGRGPGWVGGTNGACTAEGSSTGNPAEGKSTGNPAAPVVSPMAAGWSSTLRRRWWWAQLTVSFLPSPPWEPVAFSHPSPICFPHLCSWLACFGWISLHRGSGLPRNSIGLCLGPLTFSQLAELLLLWEAQNPLATPSFSLKLWPQHGPQSMVRMQNPKLRTEPVTKPDAHPPGSTAPTTGSTTCARRAKDEGFGPGSGCV